MTQTGLDSARLSASQLGAIIALVDDELWELPSACYGWRTIDVIAHLAALAHEAVDPPAPDPALPKNRERYHDMRVDERRSWTHAEVIDEWHTFTPRQLELLASSQDGSTAEDPVDVPGLGTYPRHLLANTMAFNVFCHLRNDMLAPDGPLPYALPEPTDQQVAPAIEFMLSGIPQMQEPELTATVEVPLVLELTGRGGLTVTVSPAGRPGGRLFVTAGEDGSTGITSTALDFIAWGTTRKPWRDHCQITGDAAAAEPFLDCLNII